MRRMYVLVPIYLFTRFLYLCSSVSVPIAPFARLLCLSFTMYLSMNISLLYIYVSVRMPLSTKDRQNIGLFC